MGVGVKKKSSNLKNAVPKVAFLCVSGEYGWAGGREAKHWGDKKKKNHWGGDFGLKFFIILLLSLKTKIFSPAAGGPEGDPPIHRNKITLVLPDKFQYGF